MQVIMLLETASEPKEKYRRWAIYTLYSLCGAMVLFFCGVFSMYFIAFGTTTDYMSSVSPSGAYRIELENSEPFIFGAHTIYVYGRELPTAETSAFKRLFRWAWGGQHHLLTFDLANDGKPINGNCSIEWETGDAYERVIITCDGEEQPEKTYRIERSDDGSSRVVSGE